MLLRLSKLCFAYEGQSTLFHDIDATIPCGWTGVVGRNGSGKTTLLRLLLRELSANSGDIELVGAGPTPLIEHCEQSVTSPPGRLAEFLGALDGATVRLRAALGVREDWGARWDSLSYGERKRLQVGSALHRWPDVLLLDEPTNHVDRETRGFLMQALSRFRGVGLLVSHDRALLDGLCRQCLFLEPPGVVVRPGTYTQAREQEQREVESRGAQVARTKQELARCLREQARRKHEASLADQKRSKRHLDKHDSDGRAKIDLARVSGKDGQAGRLLRQLDGKVARAQQELERVRMGARYETYLSFVGERAPRRSLFSIPPGELPLGAARCLSHPALTMAPEDRIAIIGRNGTGKSTLVRAIVSSLTIAAERLVYLPQELDANCVNGLGLHGLSREEQGKVLSIVSCLGSPPERLLHSESPSPGELRKLALAQGVARGAWLLVMDEPTNHLDLVSMQCLEEALAAYRGGILLVSHDEAFLARVANRFWHLQETAAGTTLLTR